jgi:hypothetical protein
MEARSARFLQHCREKPSGFGSFPLTLRTQRMHLCATSTGSRYITGQAPGITAIPASLHLTVALGYTLPAPKDRCIHTLGIPSRMHSSTRGSAAAAGVAITRP